MFCLVMGWPSNWSMLGIFIVVVWLRQAFARRDGLIDNFVIHAGILLRKAK